MNKATSIVEINGNRYDAVNGRLVGAVKKAAYQALRPAQGLNIDGITRRAVKAGDRAKRSVHELKRRPDRSKTLMRSSVKKTHPIKLEDKIKSRGLQPDHSRAERARQVSQNSKVQRFGLSTFSRRQEAKTGEVISNKPSAGASTRSSMVASATVPSVMSSASHYKLERLLDYALAHADAHKKSLDKKARSRRKLFGRLPRWMSIGLLTVVILSIAGYVLWRQVPAASFMLATTKAGINASLPTPISGYKIGPIKSTENAVITTIQSTSDSSKKYTVTEQGSNQPTASLAAATFASDSGSGQQVQTVQDKGKTYILSQDNEKSAAACVKGNDTVNISGVGLNSAELLEATRNACN
ncbi:hypothetical protein HYS42_01200 [Candidatus Saccharibacteria bacterium]|nr:hypothetical protein [Candidatus Saccharibacteria bacterium]